MDTENKPIYLKKSATYFKIYGSLFLFSLVMSSIVRPLLKSYSNLLDLLIALPFLSVFIMAPMGLFYSWKSSKNNEGLPKTRFKYFMSHLFFCILILISISVMVSDLAKLF